MTNDQIFKHSIRENNSNSRVDYFVGNNVVLEVVDENDEQETAYYNCHSERSEESHCVCTDYEILHFAQDDSSAVKLEIGN